MPMAEHERRLDKRLPVEIDVKVHANSGVVLGRSVDMSASGMGVVLPVELTVGEKTNLELKFGLFPTMIAATVKYRNLYRHGFQFAKRITLIEEPKTEK
jgi:PilZ domain